MAARLLILALSFSLAVGCEKKGDPPTAQKEQAAPPVATAAKTEQSAPQVVLPPPAPLLQDSLEWQAVRDNLVLLSPNSEEYKSFRAAVDAIEAAAVPSKSSEEWAESLTRLGPLLGMVTELQLATLEFYSVAKNQNPWQTDAATAKFRQRMGAAHRRWVGTRTDIPMGVFEIGREEVTLTYDLSLASLLSAFQVQILIGTPNEAGRDIEKAQRVVGDVGSRIWAERIMGQLGWSAMLQNAAMRAVEQRTGVPARSVANAATLATMLTNPTFVVGWAQVPADIPLGEAMKLAKNEAVDRTIIIQGIDYYEPSISEVTGLPKGGYIIYASWNTSSERWLSQAYFENKERAETKVAQDSLVRSLAPKLRAFKQPEPEQRTTGGSDGLHWYAANGPVSSDDLAIQTLAENVRWWEQRQQVGPQGRHRDKTKLPAELLYVASMLSERNKAGWTALHYAAWNGRLDAVQILASEYLHPLTHSGVLSDEFEVRPTPLDALSLTPLHLAALGGHAEVVKFFVEKISGDGAAEEQAEPQYPPGHPQYNPNWRPPRRGVDTTAPLWKLSQACNPYIFARPDSAYRFLTPTPPAEPRKEWTLFQFGKPASLSPQSARKQESSAIALHPPGINEPDINGWTALDYALIAGHAGVAELLKRHGAAATLTDEQLKAATQ